MASTQSVSESENKEVTQFNNEPTIQGDDDHRDILGYSECSFEYNSKTQIFKIRVWKLGGLQLPPADISQLVSLRIIANLVYDDGKQESNLSKRYRRQYCHSSTIANNFAFVQSHHSHDAFDISGDALGEEFFNFHDALMFTELTAERVSSSQSTIVFDLCVKKSGIFGGWYKIAVFKIALKEAVNNLLKQIYYFEPTSLAHTMPHTLRVSSSVQERIVCRQPLIPPFLDLEAYSGPPPDMFDTESNIDSSSNDSLSTSSQSSSVDSNEENVRCRHNSDHIMSLHEESDEDSYDDVDQPNCSTRVQNVSQISDFDFDNGVDGIQSTSQKFDYPESPLDIENINDIMPSISTEDVAEYSKHTEKLCITKENKPIDPSVPKHKLIHVKPSVNNDKIMKLAPVCDSNQSTSKSIQIEDDCVSPKYHLSSIRIEKSVKSSPDFLRSTFVSIDEHVPIQAVIPESTDDDLEVIVINATGSKQKSNNVRIVIPEDKPNFKRSQDVKVHKSKFPSKIASQFRVIVPSDNDSCTVIDMESSVSDDTIHNPLHCVLDMHSLDPPSVVSKVSGESESITKKIAHFPSRNKTTKSFADVEAGFSMEMDELVSE